MEYPAFFARFYDTIYNSMRDMTDHQFFMEEILNTSGSVLEVGVGTGRFFTDALTKGIDIYGIDISEEMIRILLDKIPESEDYRLSLQDVRQMQLNKQFDLIIAPFRVFSHLLSIEDQLMALNRIHEHLVPGGKFIFDLFVPDLQLLQDGLKEVTDFEGQTKSGISLKRKVSMSADPVHQISQVTFDIEWEENGKLKKESWNTSIRFYHQFELRHLIARSPLKLQYIYGDYQKNFLGTDSREFVVVCQK